MRSSRRATENFDTIVIGAGAAGLAASYELSLHDRQVILLEARDRIGGRVLTEPSASAMPMELGAEFIHGASPAVMHWLRKTNDVAIDASQKRWMVQQGELRPADDLLEEMKRRLDRIAPPRADLSFAEFLQRHTRAMPKTVRTLACMMVEGFDAADPTRISARDVLKEWSGSAAADAPTFRPRNGFGTVLHGIRQSLPADTVEVRLGAAVRSIRWQRGDVLVDGQRHGEPFQVRAQQVIVTLPLGVLQLPAAAPHAVRFDPALDAKQRAIASLAVGPVIKVAMRFAQPFWEDLHGGRYREAAFFHAPEARFPTLWTSLPARSPTLIAWAAGPNANALGGKSRDEIIADAVASLKATFGRLDYRGLLEGVRWHDWQRDSFSCGAYSYTLAGGASARRTLARPVENTLFFAGEACDPEEAASVGGALASGQRAAQESLAGTRSTRKRGGR